MTTIVNGATKARLVWILAQLGNVANWIRPDGEPILNGAATELQDIINNSTEPATIAPTTEVQVMTADDVAKVVAQVSGDVAAARADILGSIAAIQAPAVPTQAATTDVGTAAPAVAPAP